jgi:hypothetical protein
MELMIGIGLMIGGVFLIWLSMRPKYRKEIEVEKFSSTNNESDAICKAKRHTFIKRCAKLIKESK